MPDGQQQTFSDVQPIQQSFGDVTPIDSGGNTQPLAPSFGEGMAHASVLRNLSEQLGKAANWAEGKANQKEIENLTGIARGGEGMPIPAYSPSAGYDLLARGLRTLSGVSSPKSVATAAAIAAANTNPITGIPVDAALAIHGGYGVVRNAPAAIGGNPDAAAAALNSGAEMVGGVAGVKAGASALPGIRSTINAAQSEAARMAVSPLARKPPTATMEDINFGRGGGAGIANEGLTAASRPRLVGEINNRLGELSTATDQQLQNHPNANAQIDVEPIIDKHIDAGIQAAKKLGDQGKQTRLENLRIALKTEYGPMQGTPFEMNNLKRDIGDAGADLGAFKNTDPNEASAARAMGGIYTDIKNAVNAQVPEVGPLNQRMADLISDRMGVKRNIALNANKSPFSVIGPGHAAAKALEATVGSTPVRTAAARVLNAGNTLDVPSITASSPSRTAVTPPIMMPTSPAQQLQATGTAGPAPPNLPGGPSMFKGGINPKGIEASTAPMSVEETIDGLSTEISRMNDKLRTSSHSVEEKTALRQQINQYQQQLDELRSTGKRASR